MVAAGRVMSSLVDPVLSGDRLPELPAHLVPTLPCLDVHNLPHLLQQAQRKKAKKKAPTNFEEETEDEEEEEEEEEEDDDDDDDDEEEIDLDFSSDLALTPRTAIGHLAGLSPVPKDHHTHAFFCV